MVKNKNKKIKHSLEIGLSVLTMLFIMFTFSIVANAEVENGYEYEIVDESAVIYAYNGTAVNLVIPSTLSGKPVTEISVKDGSSFSANPVNSAYIPDSVAVIKDNSIGYQYIDGAYQKNSSFILFSNKDNTVVPKYGENSGFKAFSNNLNDYTMTLSNSSYVYTGVQKKPTVTLKYNNNTLSSGYYSVEYSNNVNAGVATAKAVGKHQLTSTSKSKTFSVTKKNVSDISVSVNHPTIVYTGKEIKPAITVTYGKITLVENTDYTLAYSNNINCGKGYATITGLGNYSGKLSAKFYIRPGKVSNSHIASVGANSVKLSWYRYPTCTGYKVFKYDQSSKTYKVYATVKGMNNSSYTVKGLSAYSKYIFKVAPYVTVDGYDRISEQGNRVYVYTRPAKVNLKYVTKSGTNLRIEWQSTTCDSYEIIYSTDKNFKKNNKTIIASKKSTIRNISGVKKNSIYYVKIRAKRVVENKGTLVGSFSRVLNTNYSYCITSFSTYLNGSSSGRLTNVKLSTSAINGTILSPGEVFDFDKIVGRRTPQRGYKEATVFNGAGVGTGYGGGVCQTSTTLFNAALRANLQIVERKQHTMKVSYINAGYDAAINWGTDDMRFRNNTKYNIKIVGKVSNGKVTFSLYSCEKVTLPKVTTSCSYNNGVYTMKRYASGKCNYTTRSKY